MRLYYFRWQFLAGRGAAPPPDHEFDVVHHVTSANLWLPALACLTDGPFVLGPVSGQRVSVALYRALGLRATAAEVLLLGLHSVSRMNPLVRVAWRRTDIILVNNQETGRGIPRRYQG